MKRITEITIKTEPDNDPDLSYLGEISDKRTYDKHWIPIDPENLNAGWFSPGNHLPHNENNWKYVSHEDRDRIIKKHGSLRQADIDYAYEDLHKLMRYGRNWWMEGIIVTAKIEVSEDGKNWAHEEIIYSLWNIESDTDKKYRDEIIEDLKSEVAHDLKIWGFQDSDIATAMPLAKEEQ